MDLDAAIAFAKEAHAGKKDKGGKDYIQHLLRVMAVVDGEHEKMTAVLHDIIEDTLNTEDDLRKKGIPEAVIEAVDALTKEEEGETYEGYLGRIKANPIATKVKLADLRDNMNLDRLIEITATDLERQEKYKMALATLQSAHEAQRGTV